MSIRSGRRSARFADMAFIAVLVTAIILIFLVKLDPVVVKAITDLLITYWTLRIARAAPGPPERPLE
jgi:hypothetical protein